MSAVAVATPRRRLSRPGGVQVALTAGVLLVVAARLTLQAAGVELGTPLPPFLARWHPRIDPLAAVSVAILAGSVALAPKLLAARIGPFGFAIAVFLLALELRVGVNLARDGWHGLYGVFDNSFEASNEYLPALPALEPGLRWFLDNFAQLAPSLPVHAAGHPPGLLVLLHALGIHSAPGLAALVIVVGSLAAPLTYMLGRRLLDDRRGRLAALLFAFSPAVLLMGASSADAAYATAGLAAAVGLLAARPAARVAGAAGLAVASFTSWALLGVGAFCVLVMARREGIRPALTLALVCGAALLAFYALLYALSGFDPLGAVSATESVYRFSLARTRPYAFWVFGSPAAFLVAAGLPLLWYGARALGRGESTALSLAAVIAVAALLGFTKAETERIWLFLIPPLCVAVAAVLPRRRATLVLALLAAQALAAELLLDTIW